MNAEVKAGYTLTELAAMMGLSRDRARRILADAGVPSRILAGKRWYWLADLQLHLPSAWASIVARADAARQGMVEDFGR